MTIVPINSASKRTTPATMSMPLDSGILRVAGAAGASSELALRPLDRGARATCSDGVSWASPVGVAVADGGGHGDGGIGVPDEDGTGPLRATGAGGSVVESASKISPCGAGRGAGVAACRGAAPALALDDDADDDAGWGVRVRVLSRTAANRSLRVDIWDDGEKWKGHVRRKPRERREIGRGGGRRVRTRKTNWGKKRQKR